MPGRAGPKAVRLSTAFIAAVVHCLAWLRVQIPPQSAMASLPLCTPSLQVTATPLFWHERVGTVVAVPVRSDEGVMFGVGGGGGGGGFGESNKRRPRAASVCWPTLLSLCALRHVGVGDRKHCIVDL